MPTVAICKIVLLAFINSFPRQLRQLFDENVIAGFWQQMGQVYRKTVRQGRRGLLAYPRRPERVVGLPQKDEAGGWPSFKRKERVAGLPQKDGEACWPTPEGRTGLLAYPQKDGESCWPNPKGPRWMLP